jgi:hypothetical protein
MSDLISVAVSGIPQIRRSLALLNTGTRTRCIKAVDESLAEAKADALAHVPRLSGELAATIRTTRQADYPRGYLEVGYGTLKRRSRSTGKRVRHRKVTLANTMPGVYAAVVEFGDAKHNKPAEPFIIPAIEATRPHHEARIAAALIGAASAAESGGAAA